jgi:hypothetical protein
MHIQDVDHAVAWRDAGFCAADADAWLSIAPTLAAPDAHLWRIAGFSPDQVDSLLAECEEVGHDET